MPLQNQRVTNAQNTVQSYLDQYNQYAADLKTEVSKLNSSYYTDAFNAVNDNFL